MKFKKQQTRRHQRLPLLLLQIMELQRLLLPPRRGANHKSCCQLTTVPLVGRI